MKLCCGALNTPGSPVLLLPPLCLPYFHQPPTWCSGFKTPDRMILRADRSGPRGVMPIFVGERIVWGRLCRHSVLSLTWALTTCVQCPAQRFLNVARSPFQFRDSQICQRPLHFNSMFTIRRGAAGAAASLAMSTAPTAAGIGQRHTRSAPPAAMHRRPPEIGPTSHGVDTVTKLAPFRTRICGCILKTLLR